MCFLSKVVAMSNVTISIDDEDLKQARIRALQEGTSLNAVIRDFVKQYINRDQQHYQQLTERMLQHTEKANFVSGGRDWTRDELYER